MGTTVWEVMSSLPGRAVATPGTRSWGEKVLRTSRDKMGDLQIPRVRALRVGTVACSSESGEGHPDCTCFSGFMSDLWLPAVLGGDCDEGDNIIKQLTVSGTIVRVSCFALFHRHPPCERGMSIASCHRGGTQLGRVNSSWIRCEPQAAVHLSLPLPPAPQRQEEA